MATAGLWVAGNGKVYAFAQSPPLRRFIQRLPGVGPAGIPVASASKTEFYTAQFAGGASIPVDFYRIVMGQYQQWMHPDLPGPTKLWGYADATNGATPFRYLGPAIVATRDKPVRIKFTNLLPPVHPLPVDNTLPGAETGQLPNRASVHLHGGVVPWMSDGGPFHWFAPSGAHGPSLVDWLPDAAGKKTSDYWYPNQQSARLMWYHDHAVGITRLNAYAGLAAPYVLIDDVETGMVDAGVLPNLVGIPLVLQDKSYKKVADRRGKAGDLWYPNVYEGPNALDELPDFNRDTYGVTGRWDRGGSPIQPLPDNSCIPEFFSDNIVLNGAAYPFLEVPRRRMRFRMLNGSQARMFNLSLWYATGNGFKVNLKKPGPPIVQLGTEGGFLPAPAVFNNPPHPALGFDANGNAVGYNLLLGGAERADVVIDFSKCPNNSVLMLYNDAPAPFPGGDPRNDYYAGSGDWSPWGGVNQKGQNPAYGPDTRGVLQIRVVDDGTRDAVSYDAWLTAATNALYDAWRQGDNELDTRGATLVQKTLNEDFDQYGRLIQRLGTTVPRGLNNEGNTTYSMNYLDAITPEENMPDEGETQIWEIYNQTGDTHPIHFHIANVKIIGRAPFDEKGPTFAPIGDLRPPDANETGWKETVRMNPGEVTVVAMRFDLPNMPVKINHKFPVKVPTSPRFKGKYRVRVALPHPRARRARHDAAAGRHASVEAVGRDVPRRPRGPMARPRGLARRINWSRSGRPLVGRTGSFCSGSST